VDNAGDSITELLNEGYDTVNTTLNAYTLGANVERVNYTGSGDFVGIGNALNNRFEGGAGDDPFVDAVGTDIFGGGSGGDADIVDYRSSTVGVSINLTTNVHGGDAAGDIFGSIERFWGSNTASDTLIGNPNKNWLYGFGGDEVLEGKGHSDRVEGGAGNDTLRGENDKDVMNGGADDDTLIGGADADSFEYSALGFGHDTVTDFEDGVDKLKVYAAGVADDVSDFTITGNGTTSVVLTLNAQTSSTITLNGASAITITNADFTFY
jgi:Ca2+-binding RTX toxin-like protein